MFGRQSAGAGEPDSPKLFVYVVQRDYWTQEGERVRKGTKEELTAEQAMEGVECGVLKRFTEDDLVEQPDPAE